MFANTYLGKCHEVDLCPFCILYFYQSYRRKMSTRVKRRLKHVYVHRDVVTDLWSQSCGHTDVVTELWSQRCGHRDVVTEMYQTKLYSSIDLFSSCKLNIT